MFSRTIPLFVTLALAVGHIHGQPVNPGGAAEQPEHRFNPGKEAFSRQFARDEWRMWTSPFRPSSYHAPAVKKYVVPFALMSGALIAVDRKIADLLPNTRDQVIWSGRVSQLGASYTLAGASGAIYLLGHVTHNAHARETGWLGLQAIGHTQLIVFGLKQFTNRARPMQRGERRNGFWQAGNAFPSGHAATSFAFATVLAYEYRHRIAVPISAFSVAGLVSVSRMGARRHWASDIFVGAATGFMIGRYVYKQHHNTALPGSPVHRGSASRLMPEIGFGITDLTLSWRL